MQLLHHRAFDIGCLQRSTPLHKVCFCRRWAPTPAAAVPQQGAIVRSRELGDRRCGDQRLGHSHYVLWLPLTAIQQGENDGNPATAGDPSWQPFLNTPNYPDYTSGANNVTAALTGMLALFFGTDEVTFTVTSEHPQAMQKTRTYRRFSDMSSDMVDVRIYQGIHFRFADEEARDQGRKVAKWVFGHFAASR
jgi:hypothetical protein